MGHRAAAALLYRQAGLRAVQSLYLALLVHPEYDGVLGRIQIKPDYIGELLGKLWIVADFETPRQMRLPTMSMPDTSHGGVDHQADHVEQTRQRHALEHPQHGGKRGSKRSQANRELVRLVEFVHHFVVIGIILEPAARIHHARDAEAIQLTEK